jgi:hypothetical protein
MFGSLPILCSSSRNWNSTGETLCRDAQMRVPADYFDLLKQAVDSKTQIEYPLGVLTIAALLPFS